MSLAQRPLGHWLLRVKGHQTRGHWERPGSPPRAGDENGGTPSGAGTPGSGRGGARSLPTESNVGVPTDAAPRARGSGEGKGPASRSAKATSPGVSRDGRARVRRRGAVPGAPPRCPGAAGCQAMGHGPGISHPHDRAFYVPGTEIASTAQKIPRPERDERNVQGPSQTPRVGVRASGPRKRQHWSLKVGGLGEKSMFYSRPFLSLLCRSCPGQDGKGFRSPGQQMSR